MRWPRREIASPALASISNTHDSRRWNAQHDRSHGDGTAERVLLEDAERVVPCAGESSQTLNRGQFAMPIAGNLPTSVPSRYASRSAFHSEIGIVDSLSHPTVPDKRHGLVAEGSGWRFHSIYWVRCVVLAQESRGECRDSKSSKLRKEEELGGEIESRSEYLARSRGAEG